MVDFVVVEEHEVTGRSFAALRMTEWGARDGRVGAGDDRVGDRGGRVGIAG